MKKVGIILRNDNNLSCRKVKVLNNEIFDLLGEVIVLGIPTNFNNEINEYNRVKILIDECDGIILQGGDDVTDFDTKIAKYLYDNNIPTFGICLGMQIMAVAINGELSDLHLISHQSNKKYVHSVFIDKNSKFYNIIKQEKISVNSRHKDYILKTDLDIVGYSEDNIPEIIEDKSKKFFIGVQWHPESLNDLNSKILFNEFIKNL